MPGNEMLFALLLIAICVLAGLIAIPRVMRSWSAATKPADERLEYAAHLGEEVDQGPSSVAPAERERAAHRDQGTTSIRQL